jgi:hypothetical protein
MHRIVLMVGTMIASSIGFALAGFILGDAIKNSRRQSRSKRIANPRSAANTGILDSHLREVTLRGYDTPELHRDDTLARLKQSGSNPDAQ